MVMIKPTLGELHSSIYSVENVYHAPSKIPQGSMLTALKIKKLRFNISWPTLNFLLIRTK